MARQSVGGDYDDLWRILKSFPPKTKLLTPSAWIIDWATRHVGRPPGRLTADTECNGIYKIDINTSIVNSEIQRMSVRKKKKKKSNKTNKETGAS